MKERPPQSVSQSETREQGALNKEQEKLRERVQVALNLLNRPHPDFARAKFPLILEKGRAELMELAYSCYRIQLSLTVEKYLKHQREELDTDRILNHAVEYSEKARMWGFWDKLGDEGHELGQSIVRLAAAIQRDRGINNLGSDPDAYEYMNAADFYRGIGMTEEAMDLQKIPNDERTFSWDKSTHARAELDNLRKSVGKGALLSTPQIEDLRLEMIKILERTMKDQDDLENQRIAPE